MKTPSTKFIITLSIISTLFSFSSFADGLDGEFYVNQRWRDLTAGYSPTINPAFMIEKNQRSARLAMCYYLPDSSYLMENGMMWPVSLYGAFGVTFMGERAREYTITGDKSKHTEKMVILSFAVNPLDRLSFGHNIGILYGERFNKKYRYITLDIGVSYRFITHPILGSQLTGISLQNALSTDLPFHHWQNQPINLKFSWLAEFWEG